MRSRDEEFVSTDGVWQNSCPLRTDCIARERVGSPGRRRAHAGPRQRERGRQHDNTDGGPRMQQRVADAERPSTRRRMIYMVLAVLGLIALIAGIKVLMIMKMISGMKPPPPAIVSTAQTTYQEWQPQLRAVGTLRAARGADLALDVAGLVTHVNVQSGGGGKQGQG